MTRFYVLCLTLVLAIAVPFAAADTIQITETNLSGVSNVGSVTLTQQGVNMVKVTFTANPGFSFTIGGGAFVAFNTNASLTLNSFGPVSIMGTDGNSYSGLTFSMFDNGSFSTFGDFSVILHGLDNSPHGAVTAQTMQFTITGATVKQLELANSQGWLWGVHVCVNNPSALGCSNTGFAVGKTLTVVPEPGTLSLLGTGIIGLAGLMRRRLFA